MATLRPDVARSLETGTVLGGLSLLLALTGLLLSPTVVTRLGGPFPGLQSTFGNALYVVHLAAAALLVGFTLWHLLPFRHSFSRKARVALRTLLASHALLAFILLEAVTGYVLWAHDYRIIPKATAVFTHLAATAAVLALLAPHAWRGWLTARERRAARAKALEAATRRGRTHDAHRAHAGASRRAFIRITAFTIAGAAIAISLGRAAIDQVMDWRINSVGATPALTKENWRLRITGLVGKPIELTYADLLALPQVTQRMTHHCVEGWTYTDTFTGVRLSDVLVKAGGVKPEARTMILKSPEVSRQPFGYGIRYTSSFPHAPDVYPDLFLVHKAGSEDLPTEHGYPVRIITERKWGYKSTKWLTEIELSADEGYRGYWERFGYHAVGDYPGPIFA